MAYDGYMTAVGAAKAYARLAGYAGKRGGWIYRTTGEPGRIMCQGWDAFAILCLRRGWIQDTSNPGEMGRFVVPAEAGA